MKIRPVVLVIPLLVVFFFLACIGFRPVVIPIYLVVGWAIYLQRVVPRVHLNLSAIGLGAVCLAGLIVGVHLLSRWLYREMRRDRQTASSWKIRWTLAIVATVVLMFVSGIAAIGITHQTAWLARSDQSMFTRGGRESANRVKCASNMKQLGQAMQLYANDNGGRYPNRLEELILTVDVGSEVLVCPTSDDERAEGKTVDEIARKLRHGPHVSYVYLGQGLRLPVPPDRPLLCEPMVNHHSLGINVLFGNGHVEFLTPVEAHSVLERRWATTTPSAPP